MNDKFENYVERVVEGMVFVLGLPALVIVMTVGSPFALVGYVINWWEKKSGRTF